MNKDPRIPDLMVPRVVDINFRNLAERGFKHYCFDLDNTLVPQKGEEFAPGVCEKLQEARENGWIDRMCIISNALSGGRKRRRVLRCAERIGVADAFACDFWTYKPKPFGFHWALQVMQSRPETTVMVGDQIYSDIVGGNRMGLFTILVNPFSPDHWTTRLAGRRWREWWFLRIHGLQRP